jgi:hypothetical protein
MVTDGASDGEISLSIQQKMADLYRIVGICLGVPPETFTWEYYSKTKEFSSIGPVTPLDFYIKYVKPVFNVDDKVSVAEQYLEVGNWLEAGIDPVVCPHHMVRICVLLSHCGVCLGLLASSLPSDSN